MKGWTKNRPGMLILALLVLPGVAVLPAAAAGTEAAIISVAEADDAGDGGPETVAVAAAREWLDLVDVGSYGESWTMSATYFRSAVKKAQWEQVSAAVREPLGAVLSRELKAARYATSLPGAPDGEYVVIQFTTAFENKASAIETVTPMLDEDGAWRVSGYFIK